MADMARRSVALNGLSERIHVHAADMRTAYECIGRKACTRRSAIRRYGKRGGTLTNETAPLLLARHEPTAPSRTSRRPAPRCCVPTGG